MLKERYRLIALALFAADMTVTVLTFLCAWWLRAEILSIPLRRPLYPFNYYLPLLWVILPVWAAAFWFSGLYRSHRTISLFREISEILRAVLVGGLVLALFIFFSRTGLLYSRLVLVLFLTANAAAIIAERTAIRLAGRYARRRGYNFRNIVIVGTDNRAREFESIVRQHPSWGINILGYVTSGSESDGGGAGIIGELADLPRILRENVVDEVVFILPPAKLSLLEETFLLCEEQGIRTRVVLTYLPRQMAKVFVEMVDDVPVMTFTTAPVNVAALFIKRLIDVVLASALLILLLPLLLIVALAIKLTSPGPVLFRQIRCGLNGRRFTLLKFRSMYRDAEARRGELAHLNLMDGPVFKAKNDPRVTPAGRFLRAFSLDELPQLINIVRGDMSFVGPRPPIPEEVERYERWQRRRLSMKPGLTCLWQISGRNTLDFNTWMKLDLEYIDRWSLWLDMAIMLRTIPVVLSRQGAM